MSKTQHLYLLLAIILMLTSPTAALAEEDEGEEDAAKGLGWIAVWTGTIATTSLMLYKRVRSLPISDSTVRELSIFYKPLLSFHILLNTTGFTAGLAHGYIFSRSMEPITLSLVIVMLFLTVSGILLRYTSARNLKIFNKLIHGQLIMTILAISLVVLHILTAEE
ncbi:MAG: hypothetical protein NXY59_00490 [Aigarchaeota archaeon]|nr:hypothetical protein [Candidatus Pelearchaeum maunauluense]